MKTVISRQSSVVSKTGKALFVLAFTVNCQLMTDNCHAFDDFSVGARPAAFSGAFAGLADDVHSLYYNPAGLASLPRPEVTAYYAKLLNSFSDQSNTALTFMAFGHPLQPGGRWGAAGIGWTQFQVDSLYQEQTLTLGYGRAFSPWNLSLGGNLKVLHRKFGEDANTLNAFQGFNPGNRTLLSDPVFNGGKSAQALGLDLGAVYRPLPNMSVGMSLANLNEPDLGLSSADRVPMVTRLGAAYRFPFLKANVDVTRRKLLRGEADHRLLFGLERGWLIPRYGEMAVRGGGGVGNRGFRQITLGLGYEVNGVGMDYVFHMPLGALDAAGNSHHFSLSFRFGKSPGDQELESLIREEREATIRAEEALKLAEAEAAFVKQDRNQLLTELEGLRKELEAARRGAPMPPAGGPAPAGQKPSDRERSARDKAQREFTAAHQAAMAAYGKKVQRGATLKDRIQLLDEVLEKYRDKGVPLDKTRSELERVKSDLAQAESDYKITLDFYRQTAAKGAEPADRISLLERMSKKYGRAGIDISAVQKELEELRKKN